MLVSGEEKVNISHEQHVKVENMFNLVSLWMILGKIKDSAFNSRNV